MTWVLRYPHNRGGVGWRGEGDLVHPPEGGKKSLTVLVIERYLSSKDRPNCIGLVPECLGRAFKPLASSQGLYVPLPFILHPHSMFTSLSFAVRLDIFSTAVMREHRHIA